MPEPIDHRVVLHIQAAIQAISVASGYYYDVVDANVKLDPDHGVETLDRPDVVPPIVLIEPRPDDFVYTPANQLRVVYGWRIHWFADADVTSDPSRVLTYARGCADVEKAIAVDVTRGGLAVDTRIVRREPDFGMAGSRVWAALDVDVIVHREFGSPA